MDPEAQRRCDQRVHEATLKDASLGKLNRPAPIDEDYAEGILLQPRFGVEQVFMDVGVAQRMLCLRVRRNVSMEA